ncbi:class I SAM-dependent methyltransferase [Actinokineospora xionganensis]|uniref:class I SAM-dependent methyltransferase n=1 Tax=Actinokineospora xionganensis TaxID=2684470 RepID=UPI0028AF47E3|nr:class I SAM-dependent methyltransferase [Actinokineospora xionganensis]
MSVRFDTTGKISFDDIYIQPDPRAYYGALRELDYRIPELAKPYFLKLIHEYRETTGATEVNVLDVGCSYGINAALLRCDATMDDLYQHYADTGELGHGDLVARDRELIRARTRLDGVRFAGFDASENALSYALSTGFIDSALHADLERADPTPEQRAELAGTDLVVSTGCVGYVTEKTISRIARAQERRPWMAHFVLRMFSFDPVAESLAELGYETEAVDGDFRQRRFASAEEQAQVLDTLSSVSVDPTGLEAEGWLYARLYISRPRA